MRVRKVDAHLRLFREETVLSHFGTLLISERVAEMDVERPEFAEETEGSGVFVLRSGARKMPLPFLQITAS